MKTLINWLFPNETLESRAQIEKVLKAIEDYIGERNE